MYTLIIAASVAVIISLAWGLSGLWGGFWLGSILGFILMITISALITRRITKRIEPALKQAQRQAEGQQAKLAIQTLEGLLPLAKWQVLLGSQLHSQIGSIQFATGDEAKAAESLEKSHARIGEAQIIRAVLHWRKKERDEAVAVLEDSVKHNKKNMMMQNFLAWMEQQRGQDERALARLQEALKAEKDDKITRENLMRVQNGKKISMKAFGMAWYGLKLEKVPGSMRQGQPAGGFRPGFRQPKRRR